MTSTIIHRAGLLALAGATGAMLVGCPDKNVQTVGGTPTTVPGTAVAPTSQLHAAAPAWPVIPLHAAAPYRIAGEEALGEQGYVASASVAVVDTKLQPLSGAASTSTDASGSFNLTLNSGRAYLVRVDYGNVKTLRMYGFVKVAPDGTSRLNVNVPSTIAARILTSQLARFEGKLDEVDSQDLIDITSEIVAHLRVEDVPDLTDESSVDARANALKERLAEGTSKLRDFLSKLERLFKS